MRRLFLLPLAALLACTTDEFASTDSGSDAVAVAVDATPDGRGDAAFGGCESGTPLLCDDFERASVQGGWTAVELNDGGTLDLVPSWDGTALHASANGGTSARLRFDIAQVSSYALRVDVDVASAPGPGSRSSVIALASPSETILFEVDGKTATLHFTAGIEDTVALGAFNGRHRVEIWRELATSRVHAFVDGVPVVDVYLGTMKAGPLSLRVGVVSAGSGSVPTEVRFDDLVLAP